MFKSFPGYYREIWVLPCISDGCRRNENLFCDFSSLVDTLVGKSNDFNGAFRHRVEAIFTHGGEGIFSGAKAKFLVMKS